MATCDIQTSLTAANCYACGIIPGSVQWQAVKLALLCRIKNGVTLSCDLQTLITEGSCYTCLPPGQLAYVELALLCQIAAGGGGVAPGSTGQVMQGAADPVAAPAYPLYPAVYTNTTTGLIFTWKVSTQAWI
jgi:hypothetical protein